MLTGVILILDFQANCNFELAWGCEHWMLQGYLEIEYEVTIFSMIER